LLHYLTHPYIYFFLAGIGIWYLTEWPRVKGLRLTLPRWVLPVSVAIYAVAVIFFAAGGVSAVILFLMAILAANYGADIQNRTLLLLGNASYACYLLHTILIEFLRHLGIPSSGTFLFTAGVLIGSWVLAILWYLYVEKFISDIHKKNARVSMQNS
jgi:peptidoglycan/LPS O-acetylase OafA/YrhL